MFWTQGRPPGLRHVRGVRPNRAAEFMGRAPFSIDFHYATHCNADQRARNAATRCVLLAYDAAKCDCVSGRAAMLLLLFVNAFNAVSSYRLTKKSINALSSWRLSTSTCDVCRKRLCLCSPLFSIIHESRKSIFASATHNSY